MSQNHQYNNYNEVIYMNNILIIFIRNKQRPALSSIL